MSLAAVGGGHGQGSAAPWCRARFAFPQEPLGRKGRVGWGLHEGKGLGQCGGGARARPGCMRRIKAAPAGRKPCKRSRREQPWAGGPSWAINFSEELWRAKKFPLLRSQGGGTGHEVAAPLVAQEVDMGWIWGVPNLLK